MERLGLYIFAAIGALFLALMCWAKISAAKIRCEKCGEEFGLFGEDQ
jgi:hypothetical protein